MPTFRYPPASLTGDYVRSIAGFGVGVGVLATAPLGWAVGLVFGGMAGVFGVFGLRTLERHAARVSISGEGVAETGLRARRVPWSELETVKLRYYGTRRQEKSGDGGFMQLKLRGGGAALTFESNLEGFDYLVWRAAKAAREHGVSVDPGSAGNMLALGIDADGESPPPRHVAELAAEEEDGAAARS